MRYAKLVLIWVIVMLVVGAYLSGLTQCVDIIHLKQWALCLLGYARAHVVMAKIIFCLVCVVSVLLSFPWAALLSITAGYLFGLMSMFFLIPALTIGALGAFLIARFVLGNYVQKKWGSYLRVFNAEMERYGGWYLLLIRLMPIFPFFLVNSVIALTTISIRAYGAATFFGIIPPTLVFVFAGTQLALVNTISDILSYKVLGALGLLVILVLVPFMYQRFFARR